MIRSQGRKPKGYARADHARRQQLLAGAPAEQLDAVLPPDGPRRPLKLERPVHTIRPVQDPTGYDRTRALRKPWRHHPIYGELIANRIPGVRCTVCSTPIDEGDALWWRPKVSLPVCTTCAPVPARPISR